MQFRWMVLLLGAMAAIPAAAACDGERRVVRLHPRAAFESLLGIDIHSVPDQPPAVAFYGKLALEPSRALWIHRCLDDACSPGTTIKLDDYSMYDGQSAIVLRAGGRPLIFTNRLGQVSVFDCADAACTGGTRRTLALPMGVLDINVAVRADGRPVVAFVDQHAAEISLLDCSDQHCTSVSRHAVATYTHDLPPSIELALTDQGHPVIASTAFSRDGDYLDLIICESAVCAAPTVQRIANHYGYWLDLAVRDDRRPVLHFSASLGPISLTTCDDPGCATSTSRPLGGFSSQGFILDGANRPILRIASLIVGYYACETEDCAVLGEFHELGRTLGGGQIAVTVHEGEPALAWISNTEKTISVSACSATAVQRNGFEAGIRATPVLAP